MLEKETCMKAYFITDRESNPNTQPENANSLSHGGSTFAGSASECWLCENHFYSTERSSKFVKTEEPHTACRENRIINNHCHSTGKF